MLPELFRAEEDGLIIELPCKAGDTINQFRWNDNKFSITSDTVSRITMNRKGFTVYTKSKFYPIKTWEYDFAPVREFPNALADFYVGARESAEKRLESEKK
jgi:hypothetical protein